MVKQGLSFRRKPPSIRPAGVRRAVWRTESRTTGLDPGFRRGDNFVRWFRARRIGVLMGGTSAERTISLKTGHAIYESLKRQKFQVVSIDAAKSLPEALKRHKINFAYIALHGTGGEDGVVQGLLEWMKIPYTGSGVLASGLAMDKVASKQLFEAAKLPTAAWYVLNKPKPLSSPPLSSHPTSEIGRAHV